MRGAGGVGDLVQLHLPVINCVHSLVLFLLLILQLPSWYCEP